MDAGAIHMGQAAAVTDLNAMDMPQSQIIAAVLDRPFGVIVDDQKASVRHSAQIIIEPRYIILGGFYDFIVLHGIPPLPAIAGIGRVFQKESGNFQILLVFCDHIEVIHRHKPTGMVMDILLDSHLIAVQRDKILVTQSAVVDQYLMIRKADGAVTEGLIRLLHLFRCILSVRNIRVAVEIYFVKATAFGEKFLHNSTSFSVFFIISPYSPSVKNRKFLLFS